MWGRFWSPLYELMVPYPDKPSVDPSEEMKRQNYTVEKIFRVRVKNTFLPKNFFSFTFINSDRG